MNSTIIIFYPQTKKIFYIELSNIKRTKILSKGKRSAPKDQVFVNLFDIVKEDEPLQ